jgi:hypothetical protein
LRQRFRSIRVEVGAAVTRAGARGKEPQTS